MKEVSFVQDKFDPTIGSQVLGGSLVEYFIRYKVPYHSIFGSALKN